MDSFQDYLKTAEMLIDAYIEAKDYDSASSMCLELIKVTSKNIDESRAIRAMIMDKHDKLFKKSTLARKKYNLAQDDALDYLETKFIEWQKKEKYLFTVLNDVFELDNLIKQEQNKMRLQKFESLQTA